MGILKRFFSTVFQEGAIPFGTGSLGSGLIDIPAGNSFEHVPKQELEAHLVVARYGDFDLTDAIRPSFDLKITPQEGFRHDQYQDENSGVSIPVLMAAISRERLFETFLELLDPLGAVVDVVLETSHQRDQSGHTDLYREHIDMPVLKSILYNFEDLLTNDGCTGIAVLNPTIPQEVQLDEHKLLIIYGKELSEYETIFARHGVCCDDGMHFLTEAEHVHSSKDVYLNSFEELKTNLGMDLDYS